MCKLAFNIKNLQRMGSAVSYTKHSNDGANSFCGRAPSRMLHDHVVSAVMESRNGKSLDLTVGQVLDRAAHNWGDRDALVVTYQGVRRTFSQLHQEARNLSAGFLSLGLKPGDRVGMFGPSSHEWYLTMFATAMAGLILVNMNHAHHPRELKYSINKVGMAAIVANENHQGWDFQNVSGMSPENIRSEEVPSLRHVITISEKNNAGAHNFNDVVFAGRSEDFRKIDETTIQTFAPHYIQFTRAASGVSKGVSFSHHNVVNNAFNISKRIGYNEKHHRVCLPFPLFPICGALICVISGSTSILPCPKLNVEVAVETIEREKCTSVHGTPAMFADMLVVARRTKPDLSSLETGIIVGGSGPTQTQLMNPVFNDMKHKHKIDMVVAHGLDKASPIVFQGFYGDSKEKMETVAYPTDHVEVAIFIQGEVVLVGVTGELVTRGVGQKGQGWLRTGDEAVMDSEGYVKIIGRIEEGEDLICANPPKHEVHDDGIEEKVASWVKLNPGLSLTSILTPRQNYGGIVVKDERVEDVDVLDGQMEDEVMRC